MAEPAHRIHFAFHFHPPRPPTSPPADRDESPDDDAPPEPEPPFPIARINSSASITGASAAILMTAISISKSG